jgi:hypothetical protein
MNNCMICTSNFQDSPDDLILCEHKDGIVHLGCCVNRCSMDHNPCVHCKAEYSKDNK